MSTKPGMFRATFAAGAILIVALACASCGSLKEGMEDSNVARTAIKSELGVDANVAFQVRNGPLGRQTFVQVRLRSTPPGDAATTKKKVEDIVARSFRSHVDEVVLSL